VVTANADGTVSVLLGNGTGTPASGNPTVTSSDLNTVSGAVGKTPVNYNADVNGDGFVN
jgi:hypothetical protein